MHCNNGMVIVFFCLVWYFAFIDSISLVHLTLYCRLEIEAEIQMDPGTITYSLSTKPPGSLMCSG